MKGRDASQEIDAAKRRFSFVCRLHPSMTAEGSSIVEISELAKRSKAKSR
jgi:hypothetical protein